MKSVACTCLLIYLKEHGIKIKVVFGWFKVLFIACAHPSNGRGRVDANDAVVRPSHA